MRCTCCDKNLTDFESTRKSKVTGEYLDTCNKCLKGLGVATVDREDLIGQYNVDTDDTESEVIDVPEQFQLFDDEQYE